MNKYGLSCWLCLCEVCTRFQCPKVNRRYKLDFCMSMLYRERCPVIKCDFFQHKEKHRVYRVLRRYRKRDTILGALAEIREGIEELRKKE